MNTDGPRAGVSVSRPMVRLDPRLFGPAGREPDRPDFIATESSNTEGIMTRIKIQVKTEADAVARFQAAEPRPGRPMTADVAFLPIALGRPSLSSRCWWPG